MSDKTDTSALEQALEQDTLKAMHQQVQAHAQNNEKEPSKANRASISYNNNPVRISDSLGVIFLGILATILLWALLRTHTREREWLDKSE